MEYLEIFSACVQKYQTKLDVDSLASFCYEVKRRDSKGVSLSNLGGWQSGNIIRNPHSEFVKLLSEKQTAANAYHNKLQFKKEYNQKITNIWININGKGHANEFHIHSGAAISGTFYITDSNFPIKFKHPYEEISHYYWNEKVIDKFNNSNAGQWNIKPEKNTLLMFPPWLYHKVVMNNDDIDRISIAFNTEFERDPYNQMRQGIQNFQECPLCQQKV